VQDLDRHDGAGFTAMASFTTMDGFAAARSACLAPRAPDLAEPTLADQALGAVARDLEWVRTVQLSTLTTALCGASSSIAANGIGRDPRYGVPYRNVVITTDDAVPPRNEQPE
jgi:hypothetical protein